MHTPPQHIESRLAGLLALVLVFCVNPATTAWLLTADKHLDSRPLFYVTWLLTIALALLGSRTLLRGDRLPRAWSRPLVFIFFAWLTLYGTLFLDRLAGRLLLPPAQSLLFPANSAVRYQTPEFDVTAHVNHLGFRDREYPLKKGNKFRILVIGDSFTYGWGVNLADTWVKQLEQKLQRADPATEVLNLGRSGASPETYADIAARAIPVLQPDLVLVAVLQGNDLYQSVAEPAAAPLAPTPTGQRLLRIALANAWPNFLRLLRQAVLVSEVKPVWQQQARTIEKNLPPGQRQKLQHLDPVVQRYFRAGNLNPELVLDNLRNPDMYLHLEQVQRPEVKRGIRRMSSYLEQIRDLARRHGAATWLVKVPNKFYLCEATMREHRPLGLYLDTTLIRRNAPDSILTAETARLRLPLFQAASLRQHCGTKKLYYTYDSHFTPAGNHFFAEGVYTEINTALRQLRRQKK